MSIKNLYNMLIKCDHVVLYHFLLNVNSIHNHPAEYLRINSNIRVTLRDDKIAFYIDIYGMAYLEIRDHNYNPKIYNVKKEHYCGGHEQISTIVGMLRKSIIENLLCL